MRLGKALFVALLICLGGLTFHLVYGDHGLAHLIDIQKQHEALTAEAHAVEEENRLLTRELGLLRNDPQILEQAIRDEMKFVRPDETVYLFTDPVAPVD